MDMEADIEVQGRQTTTKAMALIDIITRAVVDTATATVTIIARLMEVEMALQVDMDDLNNLQSIRRLLEHQVMITPLQEITLIDTVVLEAAMVTTIHEEALLVHGQLNILVRRHMLVVEVVEAEAADGEIFKSISLSYVGILCILQLLVACGTSSA
jgi:hypothetical protein